MSNLYNLVYVMQYNVLIRGRHDYTFVIVSYLDILAKQPRGPVILQRTVGQPLSVLYYEFEKIPNVFIKYYSVRIQGFRIPNVPFYEVKTFPPTIGGSRQKVQLDNIQSGYKYKVQSRGVFNDDSQGKWSIISSIIVRK